MIPVLLALGLCKVSGLSFDPAEGGGGWWVISLIVVAHWLKIYPYWRHRD
jgi:hypothetical protein